MYRICIFIIFCVINLYSGIMPSISFDTHLEITSMQQKGDTILVSTSQGKVQIYTLKNTLEFIQSIQIPDYKDLFDIVYTPKVFNTDMNESGEILIVATSNNGTRNLYVYKNKNIHILLEHMNIAKAVWINETQIAIALLSHEILLFDTQEKRVLYQTQITQASFSDMFYNAKNKILYTTGESGVVYAVNPNNGTILAQYDTINKDKIFNIAFGGHTLVGAGQDKRLSIYTLQEGKSLIHSDFILSNFLVYAVGIDSDGRYIGYMSDENGSVHLIQTQNKKLITTLEGISGIVNSILFYKHYVLVSCDGSKIYIFNTKGIL